MCFPGALCSREREFVGVRWVNYLLTAIGSRGAETSNEGPGIHDVLRCCPETPACGDCGFAAATKINLSCPVCPVQELGQLRILVLEYASGKEPWNNSTTRCLTPTGQTGWHRMAIAGLQEECLWSGSVGDMECIIENQLLTVDRITLSWFTVITVIRLAA